MSNSRINTGTLGALTTVSGNEFQMLHKQLTIEVHACIHARIGLTLEKFYLYPVVITESANIRKSLVCM